MSDQAPFNPESYGPVLAALMTAPEPEEPIAVTLDEAFAHTGLGDRDAGVCCLAAVWLRFGRLDDAHRLCQDVPSASGSYLHGVVHRREGDYWNAKYWFRRAGDHPAGPTIAAEAARHASTRVLGAGGVWNAAGFVDVCEGTDRSADASVIAEVDAVRAAEWRALFDWCYHEATA